MTECYKITGIHVLYINNCEPSHGGNLADTAGAILKKALWIWTRKWRKAISEARQSVEAAADMGLDGHVPLITWNAHDDEWQLGGSLQGVSITNSLHKEFPRNGRYAGGIIVRLYVGVGVGVGFTAVQVKSLMGGHSFVDVARTIETSDGNVDTTQSVSHRSSKQRKAHRESVKQELQAKVEDRKEKSVLQQALVPAVQKRKTATALLRTRKRSRQDGYTLSETASLVTKFGTAPRHFQPLSDIATSNDDKGWNRVKVDKCHLHRKPDGSYKFFTTSDNGVVTDCTGWLAGFDTRGWIFNENEFVRPRPRPPRRGFATRESIVKFEWTDDMRNFVMERCTGHDAAKDVAHASILDDMLHSGRWSDLLCPSLKQIRNLCNSFFAKKKAAAAHALQRAGKRSYRNYSLKWLKAECRSRELRVGGNGVPGCIKMLEQHDDDQFYNVNVDSRNPLCKLHQIEDYPQEDVLTFARFKSGQQQSVVPQLEWLQKECAYHNLSVGQKKESGLWKLLYDNYLDNPSSQENRHDSDHQSTTPLHYKLDEVVQVHYQGKWYRAVVSRVYKNDTYDVDYSNGDTYFNTRLPITLLRSTVIMSVTVVLTMS